MIPTMRLYNEDKELRFDPSTQNILEMDTMEVLSLIEDQDEALRGLPWDARLRVVEGQAALIVAHAPYLLTHPEELTRYSATAMETALIWEQG